ncbi:MAG TPA: hypothetical protein VE263_14440 [Candidatus Angelobacter sp.]|nr:hypothetical protein [Candidatus Angelobacter sp.]
MGIAAEILGLRNDHFSSVAELLAALEQVSDAPVGKITARVFMAGAAADRVLTNVAAHAADALSEPPTKRKTRRAASPARRKSRRSDLRVLLGQRTLFA